MWSEPRGLLRLDLFVAAGVPLVGAVTVPVVNLTLAYVGVAATGVVIGLGSNPTHQVVSWVTDTAKARRTAALGTPEGGDGASAPAAPLIGSVSLGAALAAAREAIADANPDATMSVPGSRVARSTTGIDFGTLADDALEVALSAGRRQTVRREPDGRRVLLVESGSLADHVAIDRPALPTQIEMDVTGLTVPGNEVISVASPPRARPITLNLQRKK